MEIQVYDGAPFLGQVVFVLLRFFGQNESVTLTFERTSGTNSDVTWSDQNDAFRPERQKGLALFARRLSISDLPDAALETVLDWIKDGVVMFRDKRTFLGEPDVSETYAKAPAGSEGNADAAGGSELPEKGAADA